MHPKRPRSTPHQLCEVMVTALKASLLHRDRSAPVQPMTLVVLASCKKCERHRGLVKDLLAKGLETEVVFTPDDLEDLLAELVSLKNQGGNRGGVTPYQPVIGQNPRAPHELLSDDPADEVGLQELSRDDADRDSPAKAFKHSVQIRDHARMLMETYTARERLRSAAPSRPKLRWVYVGARDRTGGPALSRWVGPGLVALQDGTTVWVSVRGRLWKCVREQIRGSDESLGAELQTHDHHLRQLFTDAGSPQTLTEAVDVSAEWTPEGDQSLRHHPDAPPTNENETRNQQPHGCAFFLHRNVVSQKLRQA